MGYFRRFSVPGDCCGGAGAVGGTAATVDAEALQGRRLSTLARLQTENRRRPFNSSTFVGECLDSSFSCTSFSLSGGVDPYHAIYASSFNIPIRLPVGLVVTGLVFDELRVRDPFSDPVSLPWFGIPRQPVHSS